MNFRKTERFFAGGVLYCTSPLARGGQYSPQQCHSLILGAMILSLWAKASVRAVSYCKNGPRHRWAAGVPRLRLRNDCCTTTAASQ